MTGIYKCHIEGGAFLNSAGKSVAWLFMLAAFAGLSGAISGIPGTFLIRLSGRPITLFLTTALLIIGRPVWASPRGSSLSKEFE